VALSVMEREGVAVIVALLQTDWLTLGVTLPLGVPEVDSTPMLKDEAAEAVLP